MSKPKPRGRACLSYAFCNYLFQNYCCGLRHIELRFVRIIITSFNGYSFFFFLLKFIIRLCLIEKLVLLRSHFLSLEILREELSEFRHESFGAVVAFVSFEIESQALQTLKGNEQSVCRRRRNVQQLNFVTVACIFKFAGGA